MSLFGTGLIPGRSLGNDALDFVGFSRPFIKKKKKKKKNKKKKNLKKNIFIIFYYVSF